MVIIKIMGGLGNQLSQYAFGYWISKKFNLVLKLDLTAFETYEVREFCLKKFNIIYESASKSEIGLVKDNYVLKEKSMHYDLEIIENIKDDIYVDGYWGDWRYSQEFKDDLLEMFVPKYDISISGNSWLNLIEGMGDRAVSLHFRRGGYVTNSTCMVLPINYYYNALDCVLKSIELPVLFIFSDDIQWVKDNFQYSGDVFFVDDDRDNIEDFWLMSRCACNVIANSSYSYWSAYINKNDFVIYPSQYFKSDNPYLVAIYGEVTQPSYPVEWVKLAIDSKRNSRVGVIFSTEKLDADESLFLFGQQEAVDFIDVTNNINVDLEKIDLFLFLGIPDKKNYYFQRIFDISTKKILIIRESPVVRACDWDLDSHKLFDTIFLWHDDLVDFKKYRKLNIPYKIGFKESDVKWNEKKLCVLFEKFNAYNHPQQLCSKLLELVNWFNEHGEGNLDVYGDGWVGSKLVNDFDGFSSKNKCLSNYRFSICFEDSIGYTGYISNKIFESFEVGCVPVYLGASNIDSHIPKECFIDFRDFQDFKEFYEYIKSFDNAAYERWMLATTFFMNSHSPNAINQQYSYPFSIESFVWTVLHFIKREIKRVANDLPLISIAVPTFNNSNYIKTCIDSILQQRVGNFEVVVIDNCSTDETMDVLAGYSSNSQIRVYKNPVNYGSYTNHVRAFDAAYGEYYAVLHSDDFYGENHLVPLLILLETYRFCVLAYRPCIWVDERGGILNAPKHRGHLSENYIGTRNEVLNLLVYDNYITPSSAIIRKDDVDKVYFSENGGLKNTFPRSFFGAGDWALWVLLGYIYKDFIFLKTPAVNYRWHQNQHSNSFYKTIEPLLDHISLLETVLRYPGIVDFIGDHVSDIIDHLDSRASLYNNSIGEDVVFRINSIKNEFSNLYSHSFESEDFAVLDSRPLISIILPTCNRAWMLKDALFSIKNQTYENWEVIIVNEGNDDVKGLVSDIIGFGHYKYLEHRDSFGLSAARNTGIRLSSGGIICFLDDDDLFLPDHLQTIVDVMQGSNIPIVYTDADTVLEVVNGETRLEQSKSNPYQHDVFSKDRLCVQNYIPVNTWACRWECFQKIGFFDETLKSFEDWDALLRLSRYYNFVHIPKTTVEVRRRINTKDHMTDRERSTFPQLYRKIYERTKDLETPEISIQRNKLLESFERNNGNRVSVTANKNRTEIGDPYKDWQKKHTLVEADGQILAERMHTWNVSPNFLILTVFESTNTALLADTIDSLNRQFYSQWSLAIVSAMPSPDPLFDEMEMVHWLQVDDDPFQAINQVLASVDVFDWVTVVSPGTIFSENALSVTSNYINTKPEWCFIYSDEDSIDMNGTFINPLFKPDFNLELLRSMPYIGDACFVRKSVVDEFGGYCGLAGVLSWDLGLKVYEKLGKSFIGHVSEVLLHKPKLVVSDVENKYLVAAEKLTLHRHFERLGVQAAVADGLVEHTYFVEYPVTTQPMVSVVLTVLSIEQLNRLSECIQTIVKNTEYSDYEIVITSKLSESEVSVVIDKLDIGNIKVTHLVYQGNSISPLNNKSLNDLNGDYVLLFNPDLLVLHNYWLETLMAQALRNEVGVVGARIVDKNKQVHHAGIILGMGDFGVADYPNRHLPMSDPGYMNRAVVTQNFSAVSTQCFLVKKALWVDCLETDSNVFDHVDFCLQVIQRGFSIVWTPFVTLMLTQQTLQERTMDQLRQDADQMIKKWLPKLANDPAYNRNLSLKHRHFQIETETDVTWNVDFHDRPRVYAFPANESGIGEYRVRAPLRALTHAAMIESSLLPNHSSTLIPDIVEIERVKPDTLLLQNGTADYLIHAWQQYRKFNDVFMIYSQDDLIHMLPGKHPLQAKWPKDVRRRLSKLMEHSDRLIVATEPLREAYSKYITDIKLVPNYLEKARWLDLKPNKQIRNGKKLRVGWAGGGQHHGDLEFIAPVIEATQDEVDWVFMGMCLDQIRPFIKEYHAGVAFDLYPQKLADLDLDLAIAPLEYNNFNMAKTNLRLLEYGVLGWPVLCSDITPYQGAPVTLVGNNVNHWVKAIREKIHEPEALLKEGQALQQWVLNNYLLEDHLDEWLAALTP